MTVESDIKFGAGQVNLSPSPIYPTWILEGKPTARKKVLSSSADGIATTLMWDCTQGRFNWFYDVDETVYVIEGAVIIKDSTGVSRRFSAGDSIFFPAGASAEWTVENYIRKIAFCRAPLSRPLRVAQRVYRLLKRMVGRGASKDALPAMFQGG